MRLTICLLRRNYFPNGHIYRGKNRLVQAVTPMDLARLRYSFETEENNMLLLRHSYLTEAESRGHAAVLGKTEARIDRYRQQKAFKKPSVSIEDILNHLNVTKRWD